MKSTLRPDIDGDSGKFLNHSLLEGKLESSIILYLPVLSAHPH